MRTTSGVSEIGPVRLPPTISVTSGRIGWSVVTWISSWNAEVTGRLQLDVDEVPALHGPRHSSPLRSASGSGTAVATTSSGLLVVILRIFRSGLSAEAMANFVD